MMPLAGTAQTGAAQASDTLVQRALANEVRATADSSHPMRYRLRKQSPRLSSTKEIFETRDGAVARLIAINDRPLNPSDEQKELSRLRSLLADPGKQWHRKQAEQEDAARAVKVLRALPDAFLYQYAGQVEGSSGLVERFTFRPNPSYDPLDLETQVLKQMSGEIWIDSAQQRVTRLEGHLQQDVDFGWGILGRLNKGGWIVLEQADIGDHQWRTVHFQMAMTGRVVFRTKIFDTTQDQSSFAPVPPQLSYQKAIEMLLTTDARTSRRKTSYPSR